MSDSTANERVSSAWYPTQFRTVATLVFCLTVAALFFKMMVTKIWMWSADATPGHPVTYGDFFALWSYARVAALYPVRELYDYPLLHAHQVALGMTEDRNFPFPYPPTFIPLLRALDILPYDLSFAIVMAATLALSLWVIWRTCTKRWPLLLACLIAPVTIGNIFVGQLGFLFAALLVAGIRLADRQPLLAGVLLGLASYKAQLGLLVPVALASARLWRPFAAAAATMAVMAALATGMYGWQIWVEWIGMLPGYSDGFDHVVANLRAKPTVMANLQLFGLSLTTARVLQWCATALVVVIIWRVFQQGNGPMPAAALLIGTFIATPHAFYYDLPPMLAGLTLFIEDRLETRSGFKAAEVAVLVLAYLFPITMMVSTMNIPGSMIYLALAFVMVVYSHWGRR